MWEVPRAAFRRLQTHHGAMDQGFTGPRRTTRIHTNPNIHSLTLVLAWGGMANCVRCGPHLLSGSDDSVLRPDVQRLFRVCP